MLHICFDRCAAARCNCRRPVTTAAILGSTTPAVTPAALATVTPAAAAVGAAAPEAIAEAFEANAAGACTFDECHANAEAMSGMMPTE